AFRGVRVTDAPLPGAGLLPARPAGLDPEAWDHLTHLYGSDAGRVAELGPEPLQAGGPDVWGQVLYAADQEWAATVEDVVRRRTTLEVRGLDTPAVRQKIAATLAERGVLFSRDAS
ncbi:MAG: glycerol-3-phosphate dehydrogenase/oxidase, partial [Candidatus Dormibacteraeota bacterium]|nr:glycerol-3-phosphate dehydrogenase/oxidase [Candidatus Dormibacteraeota bacterium]